LRCVPRKAANNDAINGVPQREVQMGWLIPACMLAMVIISAVTLTRL
jgi:branched-subunit amino acid permease